MQIRYTAQKGGREKKREEEKRGDKIQVKSNGMKTIPSNTTGMVFITAFTLRALYPLN